MAEGNRIRVWDPLVRIGHWTLVLAVAAAWFTSEGNHELHEAIGYVALAVVVVRLAWGFIGPRYARFSQFVRGPAATLRYTGQLVHGREPRYIGHNPLGGWMIVALLLGTALTALSGVLYTTDRFWGVEWVEDLHEGLANTLLVLAAFHIGGVIVESLRQREDLVGSMFHGRKRAPRRDDVI
jgi:cytochrome b